MDRIAPPLTAQLRWFAHLRWFPPYKVWSTIGRLAFGCTEYRQAPQDILERHRTFERHNFRLICRGTQKLLGAQLRRKSCLVRECRVTRLSPPWLCFGGNESHECWQAVFYQDSLHTPKLDQNGAKPLVSSIPEGPHVLFHLWRSPLHFSPRSLVERLPT